MLVTAVLIIFIIFLIKFSIRFLILVRDFPRLSKAENIGNLLPLVSIIVPARNEEDDIKRCIDSLLDLDYDNKEIIVVDDNSTDGTPKILAGYNDRIKVVNAGRLPGGWVGKNWACSRGYQRTRGELLLFTDADTVHTPWSLSSSVQYFLEHEAHMLSLWPKMIMGSFWEKLLLPVIFHLMFLDFRGDKINHTENHNAAAFGPYIMFRKDAYDFIGGHTSVKESFEEDYRLAERIKVAKFKLIALYGTNMVATRMYSNLHEIWEGWIKNTHESYEGNILSAVSDIFKVFTMFLSPYFLFFYGIGASVFTSKHLYVILGGIMILISFLRQYLLLSASEYDPKYAIFYPIAISLCLAIMLYSLYVEFTHRDRIWKGRVYF